MGWDGEEWSRVVVCGGVGKGGVSGYGGGSKRGGTKCSEGNEVVRIFGDLRRWCAMWWCDAVRCVRVVWWCSGVKCGVVRDVHLAGTSNAGDT